jgi:uncharacterized protein
LIADIFAWFQIAAHAFTNIPISFYALYLLAGAFVGFLAGLLGIGGGMMLVPMLSAIFTAQHFAPDHIVHMALATGMASVIFTSSSSVRAHHAKSAVDWSIVKRMVLPMMLGTLSSSFASGWIEQKTLAIGFVAIVYGGAYQIYSGKKPAHGKTMPSTLWLWAFGLPIGFICGFVSAGGTFLTVPLMLYFGVPMISAVGTGAALGVPVAIFGTIGFILSGWKVPGLPDPHLGFVIIPALFALVVVSVLTAPFGAKLAHRLPTQTLKKVFALSLFLVATRMLVKYW